MNARTQALARQDEQIQQNVAAIEAQRPPRQNALQAMGSRLNITPSKLESTLRNTVFRDANDDEFAALIIVANEYQLNPLTKEIYAFKAKGGGIIPYVSVDGWIRIINEHAQFDGMEFNDIVDERGNIEAIECIIYRKDRTRPTKVMEYLEECVMDTGPWKKSPKRFLRHRALMQCARVAFGFSGINAEDEYETVDGGVIGQTTRMPTRQDFAEDDPPAIMQHVSRDPEPASDEEDEETARALDAQIQHGATIDEETGEIVEEEQEEVIQQGSGQRPMTVAEDLGERIARAESRKALKEAEDEFMRICVTLSDQECDSLEREVKAAKKRLGIT